MCWNGEQRAWKTTLTDCKRFSNEAQTRGETAWRTTFAMLKQLPPSFATGEQSFVVRSVAFFSQCPPNATQVCSVIQFSWALKAFISWSSRRHQTGQRKVQEVPLWDLLKLDVNGFLELLSDKQLTWGWIMFSSIQIAAALQCYFARELHRSDFNCRLADPTFPIETSFTWP